MIVLFVWERVQVGERAEGEGENLKRSPQSAQRSHLGLAISTLRSWPEPLWEELPKAGKEPPEGIQGSRAQCHTSTGVLPAPNSQSAKFHRAGASFPFLYSSQNWISLPRGVKNMCFLEMQPKQELPPLLVGPPAMLYLPQATNSNI